MYQKQQQQQQHSSTLKLNTADAVITVPMFQMERTTVIMTVLKVSDSASTHTRWFGVDGTIEMRMEHAQFMVCVKLQNTKPKDDVL